MQSEQHCPNTGPERSYAKTKNNLSCYGDTVSNSNLNNSNAFIPAVNSNDIEYFIPGPSKKNNRTASIELTKQL